MVLGIGQSYAFNDTNSKEINYLVNKGVISGFSDGTFRPHETITRKQLIMMIVRELGVKKPISNVKFNDVNPSSVGFKEVAIGLEMGLIDGYKDGTFRPNDNVTRAQMAKILVNAYQLQDKAGTKFDDVIDGNWASPYIYQLVAHVNYKDVNFRPNDYATRQEFSKFLYDIIYVESVEGTEENGDVLEEYYFEFIPGTKYVDEIPELTNYAKKANESVFTEFGYLNGIQDIMKQNIVKIFVKDKADHTASEGHWSIGWNTDNNGNTDWTVNVLAKGAHKSLCCTSLGGEFDDLYFKTTMIHELDTVVLNKLVSTKKNNGWNYLYDADEWFVQGFQEYLGYKYAENPLLLTHINKMKKNRKHIRFQTDRIEVRDVYSEGLVLVQFLHEVYGKEKVHRILLSPKETFRQAFLTEIGDIETVEIAFDSWLEKQ